MRLSVNKTWLGCPASCVGGDSRAKADDRNISGEPANWKLLPRWMQDQRCAAFGEGTPQKVELVKKVFKRPFRAILNNDE